MFRMLKFWLPQNLLFYAKVYAVGRASNTELLMLILDFKVDYVIIGWKDKEVFCGKHGISWQGYIEKKKQVDILISKSQVLQMLYGV